MRADGRKVMAFAGFKTLTCVFLVLIAGAVLSASCGKDGPRTASAREGASGTGLARASAPDAPAAEASIVLPGIERRVGEVLIVYRHTQFGFMETHGFDTVVHRFSLLPGGWIDGAAVYERRMEGERLVANYGFSHAGDYIYVSRSSAGESAEFASIRLGAGGLELGGARQSLVSRGPDGGIRISSLTGEYLEEYRAAGKGGGIEYAISRAGVVESTGRSEIPAQGRLVFTDRRTGDEHGAEDRTVSLWREGKDDYRFRTESVIPVNEVFASGLEEALGGEKGMQNFVLVDLVLGRERNMRPVLAYALFSGSAALKP